MKIEKVFLYLITAILVVWGLVLILASASPSAHTSWLFTGLVCLTIGFALFWYANRAKKAQPVFSRVHSNAPTQIENPKSKKNLLALLLMGIPVGGLCGAISGCLLLYLIAKSDEPRWTKLPSPPERPTTIISMTMNTTGIDVLLHTEWERLFTCSSNKTECSLAELSEDQAMNLAVSHPCNSRPAQSEITPPPPGKIVDSCKFLYIEFFVTAILLEEGSLWWYSPGSNIDVAFIAGLGGLFLGGMTGLVIGLVWAVRKNRTVPQV